MKEKLKKLQLGKLFKTKKGIILVGIFVVVLLILGIGFSYSYYYKDDVDIIITGDTILKKNDIEINVFIQKRNSRGSPTSGFDQVYFLPEYGYTFANAACTNGIRFNGITNGKVNVTAIKRGKCDLYYYADSNNSIQSNVSDGLFNLYVEQTDGEGDYVQSGEIPDNEFNYIINMAHTTSACNMSFINQYGELVVKTNANVTCDIYLDIDNWRSVYQEVEYIANSSTSYIDTGIPPSVFINDYSYEVGFSNTSKPSATQYVVGTTYGSTAATSRSGNLDLTTSGTNYVYVNNSSQGYFNIGTGSPILSAVNNLKFEAKRSKNGTYAGEVKYTLNGLSFSSTGEYYSESTTNYTLFNLDGSYYYIGKIYYFRIYDGDGNLVRSFIPVYRKSDNVIGMYDLVSGEFKTNAGSGTFSKGGNVDSSWKNLYQEVEYLESHGTEYIKTNILSTNTTGFCINLEPINTVKDQVYLGTINSSVSSRLHIGNNEGKVYYGWNSNLAIASRPEIYDGMQFEACQNYLNARTRTFNGVAYTAIGSTALVSGNNYPLAIFTLNYNNEFLTYISKIKLYSLDISVGTAISYSFIPVVRRNDGKPGLYDKKNYIFYTNAGTGEFSYGRPIKK